jgi:hypothetical protein
MPTIEKNTIASNGGICKSKIEFIDANANIILGDVIEMEYNEAATLNGNEWQDLYFVDETASWQEEELNVDGSLPFKTSVRGVVSLDSKQRLNSIYELSRKNWLVKFTDHQNQTRLLGEPGMGCAVSFKRNGKPSIKELQEFSVEFSVVMLNPCPFYPF